VAFSARGVTGYDIWIINDDGSGRVRLTATEEDERYPAWSPDGAKLAYAYYLDGNWDIYTINTDGSHAMRLTSHPRPDVRPQWSPDGSKILFESQGDPYWNTWDIYVMDADGSHQRNLTHDPWDDVEASWSPDGARILFLSNRRQHGAYYDIYVMNADGSNQMCLTGGWTGSFGSASWLDNDTIGFERCEAPYGHLCNIWTVKADGTGWTRISNYSTPWSATNPQWSPDRTRVIFKLFETPEGNFLPRGLYVMNADGTDVSCLIPPAWIGFCQWWRDGSKVVFRWLLGNDWNIYSVALDGSGRIDKLFALMEENAGISEIESIVWQP